MVWNEHLNSSDPKQATVPWPKVALLVWLSIDLCTQDVNARRPLEREVTSPHISGEATLFTQKLKGKAILQKMRVATGASHLQSAREQRLWGSSPSTTQWRILHAEQLSSAQGDHTASGLTGRPALPLPFVC